METEVKILLVGADRTNPTDGVIVKGILNLLTEAYKEFQYEYIFLDDHQPMDESTLYPNGQFDLIVICGTPWLWDSFCFTPKYNNLLKIFKLHKQSKRLFMGIGTCLNLNDIQSDILKRKHEIAGMKELFSGSSVIVREELAKERLLLADIESTYYPCPAYFAYDDFVFSDMKNNIMIWCDPQRTISSGDWHDKKKLNRYYEIYQEFHNLFDPIVYCAFENEKQKAVEIGLPEPKVLSGYQDTLNIFKHGKYVLSGRVHCAVPAYSAGCLTMLTPLDSRARTFIGSSVCNRNELLQGIRVCDNMGMENYKKLYGRFLSGLF